MKTLSRDYEGKMCGWLRELSAVGVTEDGLWRRPYTPEYEQASAMVASWMREAGLTVRLDEVGNLIGRVEGTMPGGKTVAVGSHIDTVRGGGDYDGNLGVVGGIAAVSHLLREHGRPSRSLEVIAFIGEEGSRFPGGFLGSKWMAGAFNQAELDKKDEKGITMREAALAGGYTPDPAKDRPRADVDCFLELHIEQGPVLESLGRSIGVVTSIVGIKQAIVTVSGRADHAGTTPMGMRRDALLAASKMIAAMDHTVRTTGGDTRFTVGRISVRPGAANVVAGEARFSMDLRDVSSEKLASLYDALKAESEKAAAECAVRVEWEEALNTDPVPCDPRLREVLASASRALGVEPVELVSGAGHDGVMVSRFARIGMLFVPSVGGRSHCREEFTRPGDCWLGAAVLAEALLALAYR